MSCYTIYYKDGAKWMRPVRSEAEYRALRDSERNRAADKRHMVQMNYSCLPEPTSGDANSGCGPLKGCTRASDSVGMDIDFDPNDPDYEQRMAEVPQMIMAKQEELGLLMLERSATKGYHIAFRRRPGLSQEENLRWASELLGVEYDEGAKDITRVFFTPADKLLFVSEELFDPTPSLDLAQASTSEVTTPLPLRVLAADGRLDKPSARRRGFSRGEGQGEGLYPLSDIAASWILYQGEPRQGERHTCYYQMASYFRYITDNNARLIFDHLPDFGLGAEERWKICDHVVKLSNGGRIPYEFYRFLVDHGYKERPGQQRKEEGDTEVDEAAASPAPAPELPVLPPVVRDLVGVAPVDFKVPTVFALFPILATHCTRIRARYYDGAEHSPSCATVIIAPQGSGKSFVHRFDPLLVHKFEERDDAEIERLNTYLAEKEEHRNDKKQPKEVRVPLRLLPAKISVTQFLDRQLDAHGLHQLTICDELDTFTKSNDGGSWADKSDVYRVAYDNGTYGQDYKNQTIYKGRVRLHYNWLVTGTPKSVGRFFRDVEDGLVSRVAFCRIENQLFSDFSLWESLSRKQQTQIHRIVDRLDALTYDEEGNVRPTKMVDMSWLFEPLHQWLLGKLQMARKGWNVAMDTYRRRAAVNAFRYALICTQLYGRLDANIRQEITEFTLWFAEQDLQNRLDLFQQRLNDEAPTAGGNVTQQQTLFDLLPEKFGKDDVRTLCRTLGIKSEPRYIICIWKKNGDILKLGSGQWMKVG